MRCVLPLPRRLRNFFGKSLGLLLCCSAEFLLSARGQTISLAVDANQTVRTVDERVFGVNAVMWDGQTGTSQTLSLLQAAGVRAIRIPGGSASDEYHWNVNKSLTNTFTWAAGFDKFSNLITGLNSQAFVTVNYGTGTPEEAAAWVAYANANTGATTAIGTDAKGVDWKTAGYWANVRGGSPISPDDGSNFLRVSRATPLGIKYWEIGNECYGSWETDSHAKKWDPVTYATVVKDYIAKMKAVDPTIKIGVVVQTGEDTLDASSPVQFVTNPRTGAQHKGWTPVMLATLRTLAATPDFIIYHRYEQAPKVDQPGNPETDAGLLQKAKTWPNDADNLRQQLSDYLGAAGAGVEIVVTENNSVYAKPGKQTTSLVNGLYLADSVGNILQTQINGLVWWDLRNGQENSNNNDASLYGWRAYGDYGILSSPSSFGSATAYEGYPTYYALKLLSKFARGGDTVVKATSDSLLLSVFAAKRSDGSLALLVINKSPTNSQTATIALSGHLPATTAAVYSYGKPQDDAAKPGGNGATDLSTTSMSIAGATFSATFASYSATVMVMGAASLPNTPSVNTPPAATVGQRVSLTLGSGSTISSLRWQRLPVGASTWENLQEGGSYRGVTTTSLTIDPVSAGMSGDQFRVTGTTATGEPVVTGAIVLTVSGAGLLQYPVGVAVDASGNLFIADSAANVIRKITPAGTITIWAGSAGASGSVDAVGANARFNSPGAIAIDRAGVLYVADTGNGTIRKIATDGAVTTLAGSVASRGNADGTGTGATFNSPAALAVDASGNVYVADAMNATLRKITSGGVVTTLAGSALSRGDTDGQGGAARFNNPNGITIDGAGNLFVTDSFNATIRKITSNGAVTTLAGLSGVSGASDGSGNNAFFNLPSGLVVDPTGTLYVADTGNSAIRKVTANGSVTTFAGLAGVAGLTNGSGTSALFNQPHGLALDGAGNLYVADTGNALIRKLATDGTVTVIVLSEPAPANPGTTNPPPSSGSGGSTGGGGGSGGGSMNAWFGFAILLLGLGRAAFGRPSRR